MSHPVRYIRRFTLLTTWAKEKKPQPLFIPRTWKSFWNIIFFVSPCTIQGVSVLLHHHYIQGVSKLAHLMCSKLLLISLDLYKNVHNKAKNKKNFGNSSRLVHLSSFFAAKIVFFFANGKSGCWRFGFSRAFEENAAEKEAKRRTNVRACEWV